MLIGFLAIFLIVSCQEKREFKTYNKKAENLECSSNFVNGIYYNGNFFLSSLNCTFVYSYNLKLIRSYGMSGSFFISNDSLFLISNDTLFYYKNDSFVKIGEFKNLLGYENGYYIFKNMVVYRNDTFRINEIETYIKLANSLVIGTNGYGLYFIENRRLKRIMLGKIPSNFIKAIAIRGDSIIIGFSEPFSKSKVGFFKDKTIKVYEFSDDYITDIFSNGEVLLVGTTNGLFEYKNNEFSKVLDGYISKIIHILKDSVYLILNGEVKVLKTS
ncbi:MAG: hypothetical protein N2504_06985 [candidate division WOR-3 bacterium]|nr:hypothetical protein [candidate division WOR-3 bacterium]MCX7948311.1 hypothetical protein [candidate division WOR-3 bacterium]MDW8151143.1 hypothetical protein [candidate division WOR-3 bacterium]